MKRGNKILGTCLLLCLIAYGLSHLSTFDTSAEGILRSEVIALPNGYGYQIYSGDQVLIRQEFIPAIYGQTPFSSKRDAKAVADLVMEKIKNRSNPQVTKEEMEELKIRILSIP
jgi:hypothetical protein